VPAATHVALPACGVLLSRTLKPTLSVLEQINRAVAPGPERKTTRYASSPVAPRPGTRVLEYRGRSPYTRDALGPSGCRKVPDGGADRRAPSCARDRHPPVADGAERSARNPVSSGRSGRVGDPGHPARCRAPWAAGILFLDEITSAPPAVSAAAYQLILDRRLGEYRVPDRWAIFAAGNRQGDRGVTYSMPAPFGQPLLALRGRHPSGRLGRLGLCAGDRRAGDRLPALPPGAAVRFRSGAQSGRIPVAALLGVRASLSQEVRGHPRAAAGHLAGVCRAGRGDRGRRPSSTAWIRCPIWMPSWRARRCRSRARSTFSMRSPPPWWGERSGRRGTQDKGRVIGNILAYAGRFPQREMGVMLVSDLHRAVGNSLFEVPAFADWAAGRRGCDAL
jgi:hypothetical protein